MYQDLWLTQWLVDQHTADRQAEAIAHRFFREIRPGRPSRRRSLRSRLLPVEADKLTAASTVPGVVPGS